MRTLRVFCMPLFPPPCGPVLVWPRVLILVIVMVYVAVLHMIGLDPWMSISMTVAAGIAAAEISRRLLARPAR